MDTRVVASVVAIAVILLLALIFGARISKLKKAKKYERSLKMVPLLIHLPPTTEDIEAGNRDDRDVANEAISKAQVMYSILASTNTKGLKTKLYGERHFSFEIIAKDGLVRYYAIVPAVLTETVSQAIQSAYPTARIEKKREENIFKGGGGTNAVAGAELTLNKEYYLPIATYEETKRDAQMAMLNALGNVGKDEGVAVQILFRPAQKNWSDKAKQYIDNLAKGKKTKTVGAGLGDFAMDLIKAPWEVPGEHEKTEQNTLTSLKQDEITAITNKMRYPAFETLIRVIASSASLFPSAHEVQHPKQRRAGLYLPPAGAIRHSYL